MDSRVLDRNPESGVTTWFHYDEADDTFTIQDVQETEDLLDYNKARANAAAGNWRGDMHHVASIPLVVFDDLERRGITRDPKALKAWLNHPDQRAFRTKLGKV